MTYLVNRTQGNFTMIQNTVFRDQRLKLIDRGLLCTMMSLPDGWEFTINGMAAILPEGRDAIEASLKRLKALGYVSCYQSRDDGGKLGKNVVEVFSEPRAEEKEDQEIRLAFWTDTDPGEKSEPIESKERKEPTHEARQEVTIREEDKEREKWSELSTKKENVSESKQIERKPESLENREFEPCPGFPDTEKPVTALPLTATPPTGNPFTVFPEQYKNNQYKT